MMMMPRLRYAVMRLLGSKGQGPVLMFVPVLVLRRKHVQVLLDLPPLTTTNLIESTECFRCRPRLILLPTTGLINVDDGNTLEFWVRRLALTLAVQYW